MSNLPWVVVFSLIGGVFSLIGGFALLASKKKAVKIAKYATPFAAGALLAAAFVDILPEALHEAHHAANHDEIVNVMLVSSASVMIGILIFFLLERAIHWFHHHTYDTDHAHETKSATVPLVIIGDTIHNFIDGIAIAAGFLLSLPSGVVVTLAVAAHEIPQEIGDFGLLLNKGLSRKKVVLANIASALATTVAAVIFFLLGDHADIPLEVILGVTAGFFVYIAVSDIIPTIHTHEKSRFIGIQTAMLLLGVLVVSAVTLYLHQFIE